MSKVEKTPPQVSQSSGELTESTKEPREGRRLLPDKVLETERKYILKRRKEVGLENAEAQEEVDTTADSLWDENNAPTGLALSGGGIRSATFNLGVIQALAKKGILKKCDYFSTVSGGGYIGGCLTSLLSGPGLGETHENNSEQEHESHPHGTDAENLPLHDPDQIHHLRKHGNYLVTRKGAFRKEALRAIGLVVTGISSTLLIYLLAMMAAAVGFILLTGTAYSYDLWDNIHYNKIGDWIDALRLLWTGHISVFKILIYFALGVLINILSAWSSYRVFWRKLDKLDQALSTSPENAGETNNERSTGNSLWLYGGLIFVLVNIALFSPLLFQSYRNADNNILVYAVIAFFGVFSSSWVAYVCQPSRFRDKYTNPHYRSFMGAVLGIGLYAVVLSTAFIFIIALIQYFRDQTWADWAAALTAIGGFIYARLTVKQASHCSGIYPTDFCGLRKPVTASYFWNVGSSVKSGGQSMASGIYTPRSRIIVNYRSDISFHQFEPRLSSLLLSRSASRNLFSN